MVGFALREPDETLVAAVWWDEDRSPMDGGLAVIGVPGSGRRILQATEAIDAIRDLARSDPQLLVYPLPMDLDGAGAC